MFFQRLGRAHLQTNIERCCNVAIPRHQLRNFRIARMMPIPNQRGQFSVIGEPLQFYTRIVLDQGRVGGVKVFTRAQIAQNMHDKRSEGIMPVIQS